MVQKHVLLRNKTSIIPLSIADGICVWTLPFGAGSTVPREGFDSSVIMPFSWCVVALTLPI